MPVDVEPSPDGNVLLTDAHHGLNAPPLATVIDPDAPPLTGWPGTLHKSHFATCPGAADWRARKNRT
jgi:hypothetical protein